VIGLVKPPQLCSLPIMLKKTKFFFKIESKRTSSVLVSNKTSQQHSDIPRTTQGIRFKLSGLLLLLFVLLKFELNRKIVPRLPKSIESLFGNSIKFYFLVIRGGIKLKQYYLCQDFQKRLCC
jgi:hypothetical protein